MKNTPELFRALFLDKSSKSALYIQLYEKLRDMISSGTILAGYRLPSVRRLAGILKVNQVTVVSAFRKLENEGFIYKKPGSGTFVSNIYSPEAGKMHFEGNPIHDELYFKDDEPLYTGERIKITGRTINFASATPSPELFPVEDFKIVLNEVLERDRGNAFGYQDSQGYSPIRESIAGILAENNIHCSQNDIHVISGAQQGIDIISKALLKKGDMVVAESPTYTGAVAVFESREARVTEVDMGCDGPDLDILEYKLKRYNPRIIYTIPSFQNPTGYSSSAYKRRALLELAERYDAYIIEDDYVSDLDFEGRNYKSLKSIDKTGRVIFVKSFSKIFMPGLRLGFMIVPETLKNITLEAKHASDISTSELLQRAFDLYIRKGFWNRHFAFMFSTYRNRYYRMIEGLDGSLPEGISYHRPGGGLNIWLTLPYGFPVNTLISQAASNDVVFAPGWIFYYGEMPRKINNIRLSFASVNTHLIDAGIETLCRITKTLLDR